MRIPIRAEASVLAEQRTALRFDDTFTRVTATGYRTPTGCWSWPAIQWLSAISGPNRFRGVGHSVSHFRSIMRQKQPLSMSEFACTATCVARSGVQGNAAIALSEFVCTMFRSVRIRVHGG